MCSLDLFRVVRIETARRIAGLFELHDLLAHLRTRERLTRLLPERCQGQKKRADKKCGCERFQNEGDVHRYTYRDCEKRAKQLAQALIALEVQSGERIGTLAWNGYRHLEAYYGTTGFGAVCHTINPRLVPKQITWIINDADDSYVLFDTTFAKLIEWLAPLCPKVRGWIALDVAVR